MTVGYNFLVSFLGGSSFLGSSVFTSGAAGGGGAGGGSMVLATMSVIVGDSSSRLAVTVTFSSSVG